jgi:prepilin-type processing-associated H-X9-DG protein
LICPADISLSDPDDRKGDLSYVVNGGVGFTVFYQGVHDCPVDFAGRKLDLNGDGASCPADAADAAGTADKALFQQMGLFFNETWKSDVTSRHHTAATVTDGLSNTVVLSENVRTGFNPSASDDPWSSSWASPSPMLTCFHIGNPCRDARCSPGEVDYDRSNAGDAAINSGLTRPEGSSPVPNSFHAGGVNMAFADGRVQFVSESVNGGVYAAAVSPQGAALSGTPLEQPYFGGGF